MTGGEHLISTGARGVEWKWIYGLTKPRSSARGVVVGSTKNNSPRARNGVERQRNAWEKSDGR